MICYVFDVCVCFSVPKRAETPCNKCISFICYFNKKYANFIKATAVCQMLNISQKNQAIQLYF